jgi:hypothetical protein
LDSYDYKGGVIVAYIFQRDFPKGVISGVKSTLPELATDYRLLGTSTPYRSGIAQRSIDAL